MHFQNEVSSPLCCHPKASKNKVLAWPVLVKNNDHKKVVFSGHSQIRVRNHQHRAAG